MLHTQKIVSHVSNNPLGTFFSLFNVAKGIQKNLRELVKRRRTLQLWQALEGCVTREP